MIWEILTKPFLLVWSTLVGILIGVLPAIGGSAATVMAYVQAKKFSRHPERFGKGNPEGIIASEASCNANVGGSLVTIMAFGIPGDAVTAVMLGAMTIHGIQSGPLFITQHPDIAYGICGAYLQAHPLMILGLILGDQIEINLVRAIMTDANLWLSLTRRRRLYPHSAWEPSCFDVKGSRRPASKSPVMRGDKTVRKSAGAVFPLKQRFFERGFILKGQFTSFQRSPEHPQHRLPA